MVCNGAQTCEECVRTHPKCAWCSDPIFSGKRCSTDLHKEGCSVNYIEDPASNFTEIKSEELRDSVNPVQIVPQEVALRSRLRLKSTMNVKVRLSTDIPTDIYFLMDLSRSMQDILNTMKSTIKDIAVEMKTITNNLNIGFGAYVDKPVIPYIESNIRRYCKRPTCDFPYGFKNVLKLTNQETIFENSLGNVLISSSLDAPEGATDGLMQVIACKNEIGWRKKSRRFVILMTDARTHIALDGKEMIKTFFEGSTVARLEDSPRTIINLVKENFKKISAEVNMIDTSPQSVIMRYMTSCGRDGPMVETTECIGVAPGQTIEFSIDVYIHTCDEGIRNFTIKSVGLDDELLVNIDPICTCECQNNTITYSDHCSEGNGNLTCGICNCNEESFGEYCQCDATDIDEYDDRDECVGPGEKMACSGRGTCICGRCVCNTKNGVSRYSGEFCECDNLSCSPECENGICLCGVCSCHEGYTGPSCGCLSSACGVCERNNLTCNGNGVCECGRCECYGDYRGDMCQYCDVCDIWPECTEDIECIRCKAINSNQCEEKCKDLHDIGNRTLSKDLASCMDHHLNMVGLEPKQCDNKTDNCYFKYNISADEKQWYIVIGECAEVYAEVAVKKTIVIVVIASLVVCLLPLLIWRLVVYTYDNIEYRKFVKELNRTSCVVMEDNKLYNTPITSIKNPMFLSSKEEAETQ
ncbi:integrin beta-1-like isoform X2 [Anneissia japonica]|uniref:integrin beta-1-like isoform X2 n=1 Tax=Anneissia japonica TaxID=1529436 RepID=UPI0014254D38|nr:integrin beta-1-like isoform X2 [Anneissia japonica]